MVQPTGTDMALHGPGTTQHCMDPAWSQHTPTARPHSMFHEDKPPRPAARSAGTAGAWLGHSPGAAGGNGDGTLPAHSVSPLVSR